MFLRLQYDWIFPPAHRSFKCWCQPSVVCYFESTLQYFPEIANLVLTLFITATLSYLSEFAFEIWEVLAIEWSLVKWLLKQKGVCSLLLTDKHHYQPIIKQEENTQWMNLQARFCLQSPEKSITRAVFAASLHADRTSLPITILKREV